MNDPRRGGGFRVEHVTQDARPTMSETSPIVTPEVRHLLGTARMVLDRVAEGHDERQEASKVAQRIVDMIGHSVTDEPPHLLLSVKELLRYTDAHRMSVPDCVVCTGDSCFEEWTVVRDDLRRLLDGWANDSGEG
jgi:hypothetical protein